MKTYHIDRKKIILAVLSGLLLTGSFPRTGIYWLAWFALIPLLVSLRNLSPKDAFCLGFLTGLSHYLTLMYWLAYTMKTYGHLPLVVCVSILIIFSVYLALFIALMVAFTSITLIFTLLGIFQLQLPGFNRSFLKFGERSGAAFYSPG